MHKPLEKTRNLVLFQIPEFTLLRGVCYTAEYSMGRTKFAVRQVDSTFRKNLLRIQKFLLQIFYSTSAPPLNFPLSLLTSLPLTSLQFNIMMPILVSGKPSPPLYHPLPSSALPVTHGILTRAGIPHTSTPLASDLLSILISLTLSLLLVIL